MNMILLQPVDFRDEGVAWLTDERARHIHRVLKAEADQPLRIGMLNGPRGEGKVLVSDPHKVVLQCTFDTIPPPQPQTDLILAMPRPKVMKRLWAQLAALGVARIVIINAEKVERYYFDSHALDPDCIRPRLIEGLQQSGCTWLPEVMVRRQFKPFLEDELDDLFPDYTKWVADPAATQRLTDLTVSSDRNVLAIGPEGGWSPYEQEKLQTHGFQTFNMGTRILRADTACIAALSLMNEQVM